MSSIAINLETILNLSRNFSVAAAALMAATFFAACAGEHTQNILPSESGNTLSNGTFEQPNGCSWSLVSSPSAGLQNILADVKGSSATDMWAVGRYFTSSQGPLTLAQHWNGSSWTQVATPNPSPYGNALNSVVALSSSDAWAVGIQKVASVRTPLILHWNGTVWKQAIAPPTKGIDTVLYAVAGISPTNVWAVGTHYGNGGVDSPYSLHFNGKRWSSVSMPNTGAYGSVAGAVAMTAGTDVWATGGSPTGASGGVFVTFAEHWNGSKWSIVKTPNANTSNNVFNAVTAIAPKDAWAIGDYYSGTDFATLTEHWNGNAWSIVKSPNVKNVGNGLFGATSSSSKDVWAVGETFVGSSQAATLALHWNGSSWSISSSPNVKGAQDLFNSVAFTPKTSTLWAVGETLSSGTPVQPLIARKTCAL